MPLYTVELNRLANDLSAQNLTIYLHTAAPSDGDPDNGRVSTGGGVYESGATLAASDITAASNGDVQNTSEISYGEATADVGTLTHWSAFRGTAPVAWGTLPNTTVNNGDSFVINANTLQINGSTA